MTWWRRLYWIIFDPKSPCCKAKMDAYKDGIYCTHCYRTVYKKDN